MADSSPRLTGGLSVPETSVFGNSLYPVRLYNQLTQIMADSDEKLKPTKGDAAHAFVRGALSTVPLVGGPAVELFSALVTPPLAGRRDQWVKEIAQALKELQGKVDGLTLENLSDKEQFISTLLHATQIALRTHHREKLKALRNAVLNAALPDSPDDVTQQLFLNQIDDLTPWHLKLLAYYDNPAAWATKQRISFPDHPVPNPNQYIFVQLFPEFTDRSYLFEQLCHDLEARGLTDRENAWQSAQKSFTSRMGKDLLKFISDPISEE